ncbi:MAG: thioredoxin domain-containing protein [Kordiimonadaceae bacterium]|nr:thioredoxin domain-containing protein [Kordiimonadaceae bacterium]
MKFSSVFGAFLLGASLSTVAVAQEAPKPAIETPAHIHGDIVYGSADAPVELIEYASMTCPHCKSFNQTVLPELLKELIPQGKVKLVFRNFVRDRADLAVAVVSRCTTDVNVTKKLLNIFFDKQDQWMRAANPGLAIQSIAAGTGLEFDTIEKCAANREIASHIIAVTQNGAKEYDIESIPTIIMNGKKVDYRGYGDLLAQVKAAAEGK